MITKKDEAAAMQNIFPVIVNTNSTVQNVIQNIYGIIRHVNMNVKFIISVPKDYS